MHAHTQTHAHRHINICTHSRTHAYTHTCMHANTQIQYMPVLGCTTCLLSLDASCRNLCRKALTCHVTPMTPPPCGSNASTGWAVSRRSSVMMTTRRWTTLWPASGLLRRMSSRISLKKPEISSPNSWSWIRGVFSPFHHFYGGVLSFYIFFTSLAMFFSVHYFL